MEDDPALTAVPSTAAKNNPDVSPEPRRRHTQYIAPIIILLSLAAAVVILYQPVSDQLVMANANPAMVALAQQAGMSKAGELIFLRAQPQFASDAQMGSDCADNAAANNKNGFIEQGCFVPDPHNHANGRIYIRQMPANLYDQELVTASYEMLHSVYFSLESTQQASAVVQTIESNYASLHDPTLDMQVVNFANTESSYRDLELFSLIGTEFDNVSAPMEQLYAPYFTDRQLTTHSYSRITSTFQTQQTQLRQLKAAIASEDGAANVAYADSLAWAKKGNAYEDTYNYNIYTNYIAQENATIKQYNQLSIDYNALVTAYNGSQPVSSISNVQSQGLK